MRPLTRLLVLGLLLTAGAAGQSKRILYLTHSAGFRHDSIPVSAEVLARIAGDSGKLEVVATEDAAMLNAATLGGFDAVLFFTSGELPVSDSQKQALLDFVRSGKGFGGVHSATDTFYSWSEYGELIGARFNGHPWVREVRLDVEDPGHPAAARLAPGFSITDEIYQFRDFSRDRVRVLMTLDTHSVDLSAEGVNPDTEDFPLTWTRSYGEGRVFYTALGHFESTWRDPRFAGMMLDAMLWLTGQVEGEAEPLPPARPSIAPEGIANAASFAPRMTVSPGSLITIFGAGLTAGPASAADSPDLPYKLAGTVVKINGEAVPLHYASPSQINAYVPLDAQSRSCAGIPFCTGPHFNLQITAAGGDPVHARLAAATMTPGVFTVTATRDWVTLWATGLGPVEPDGDLHSTVTRPEATVDGVAAPIPFSGLAPGWMGLYQVNVLLPPQTVFPARLEFRLGGYQFIAILNP